MFISKLFSSNITHVWEEWFLCEIRYKLFARFFTLHALVSTLCLVWKLRNFITNDLGGTLESSGFCCRDRCAVETMGSRTVNKVSLRKPSIHWTVTPVSDPSSRPYTRRLYCSHEVFQTRTPFSQQKVSLHEMESVFACATVLHCPSSASLPCCSCWHEITKFNLNIFGVKNIKDGNRFLSRLVRADLAHSQ